MFLLVESLERSRFLLVDVDVGVILCLLVGLKNHDTARCSRRKKSSCCRGKRIKILFLPVGLERNNIKVYLLFCSCNIRTRYDKTKLHLL